VYIGRQHTRQILSSLSSKYECIHKEIWKITFMVLCTSRTCIFVHIFYLREANCRNISRDYSSQLLYAVHCFHVVNTYKTIFKCRHLVISCVSVYPTQAAVVCNSWCHVMQCYVVLCYGISIFFFMEDTVTHCTVISNKRGLSAFLYEHVLQTHKYWVM
jgi:hypothetical protein